MRTLLSEVTVTTVREKKLADSCQTIDHEEREYGATTLQIIVHMPKFSAVFLVCLVVGLSTRFFVAHTTFGSDDLVAWNIFVRQIDSNGLASLYMNERLFNHPLPSAVVNYLIFKLSRLLNVEFAFSFRAFYSLVDAFTAVLLLKLLQVPSSKYFDKHSASFWVLSPLAVCISAFHGNTDALYVTIIAWSLLAQTLNKPRLASFLFGLSTGVKVITLLLLPALIVYLLREKRGVSEFQWLLVGLLPCFFGVLVYSEYFSNIFMYVPAAHFYWGIGGLLKLASESKEVFAPFARVLFYGYDSTARYIVPSAALLVPIMVGRDKTRSIAELMAWAYLSALCLSPGVGVQYLLLANLLIFIVSKKDGIIFSLLSFLYAVTCYNPSVVSYFENGRIQSYSPSKVSILVGVILFAYMLDIMLRMGRKGGGTESHLHATS